MIQRTVIAGRRERSTLIGYAIAVGSIGLAVLVRFVIDPGLGDHLPYVTFFIAVAITTCVGGLGPSLAAVLLGALASNWFFMSPRHTLGIVGAMHQLGYAAYFAVALSIVGLGEAWRKAQRRAETLLSDLRAELSLRERVEEALRESEAHLAQELADTKLLQNISVELVKEDCVEGLYEKIIEAALGIMRADFASMQMFYDDRGERGNLRLLAYRGFNEQAAKFWEWVHVDSDSTCGMALRTRQRVIVPDIEICAFMAGTEDLATYFQTGIRAVQTTPLVSRNGALVGMVSTHWREPHAPDDRDLRLLDLLARQAADLMERARATADLRESEAHLRLEAQALARLNELSSRLWRTRELRGGLEEMLAASIELLSADKGNIQLLDPGRGVLTIEAQRGFDRDFLEFFRDVPATDDSACGRALRSGERIVIEDVETDPPFAPFRAIARAAGYRAVISTPLLSRDGSLLGMLSTHFRSPHPPIEQDLRRLDLYIRQAADFIERCRADEALREANALLQTATDIANLASYTWNPVTGEVQWDARLKTMFGLPSDVDVDNDVWLNAVHPGDRERVSAAVQKAVDPTGNGVYEAEYRIINVRDGREHWIAACGQTFFVEGRAVSFVGSAQDISQRKMAEAALRASEERYRRVFDNAAVGIGRVALHNATWMDVNDALCRLVGYSREDMLRTPWPDITHPDDVDLDLAPFRRMAAGELDAYTVEKRFIHKQGRFVWARLSLSLVRDEEGRPLYEVCIAENIHERKLAEEELRRRSELIRNVNDNTSELIFMKDREGRLTYANAATRRAIGADSESISPSFRDQHLFHMPEEYAAITANDRLVVESGQTHTMEEIYICADGQRAFFLSTKSPLRNDKGEIIGVIGVSRDITASKRVEEELREAKDRLQRWNVELEQAVNEKTAELRHSQDLLRALGTELNLAEQRERKRIATELHDHLQQTLVLGKLKLGTGKQLTAGLPAVEKIMKETDDVFSDALTYTRTLVAELSPTALRDHGLAAGLKWLAEYMKKHEQTVIVNVPDGMGLQLPEDQVMLVFQSVRELLINSSKHAGISEATVTMEQHDGNLSITVSDKGNGFDLAAVAAATPNGGISSKFGLFSVQERMRALGGSFTVQSALGQGTTATLTLPLPKRDERDKRDMRDTTSKPVSPVSRDSQQGSIRILLVDDHAMVRQGLRAVLDAYQDLHVVGEAQNGAEAVKLAEELRPHVVVMDINMPRMNGIEATTHIKARWPETTVIGISVNTGDGNIDAMKRAGAAIVLPKDTAVDQLHDAISGLFQHPVSS